MIKEEGENETQSGTYYSAEDTYYYSTKGRPNSFRSLFPVTMHVLSVADVPDWYTETAFGKLSATWYTL